jgi:hypothetical protein
MNIMSDNETNQNFQTAAFCAETAKLMGSLMERVSGCEVRAGTVLPEQDGVPDVVKADISEFLHTVMLLLVHCVDRMDALQLHVAAAQAVAVKNESVLSEAQAQLAQRVEDDRAETIETVKALNQRVDDLAEIKPALKQLHEMAEQLRAARAKRKPKDPTDPPVN